MASHAVYLGNLRRFPVVKLSEPVFLLSCVLVIANHFLWFRHFSLPPSMPPRPNSSSDPRYTDMNVPTFTQVASYFGICVWLVPFALFISLSASDYVLPSMGSEYATGGGGADAGPSTGGGLGAVSGGTERKKKGLAKAMVDGVREYVGESGELMGFWRGEKARRW
ncbi:MAG: isocitrate dehydrogenase (NAD(+)) idh1 [Chaenotheca gracillima]|nr:MAG: isocitrate dehydrogenase (NAD(+)) idh1 [Chaenotheca gracillima]